jgi:hypothetical protein
MRKIKVRVNPGVCGFKTEIKALSENNRQAALDIKTDCPNLKPLEAELKTADAYKEIFAKFGKSGIFETAAKYCKHSACPVPTAIIKAIEASCGLALPRDVTIEIKTDSED